MIRGIDITLYAKKQAGVDAFGAPVWEETPETVLDTLQAALGDDGTLLLPALTYENVMNCNCMESSLPTRLASPRGTRTTGTT